MRGEQLIAEPCSLAWDGLRGDGPRRHCDRCDKPVHDLSEATDAALREVIAGAGHQGLCVRVRVDDAGEVITRRRLPVLGAAAVILAVACTPHVPPREHEPPSIVAAPAPVAPAPAVAPDPRASRHMMGAIKGPHTVSPVKASARSVPCEDVVGAESADLLARCEPPIGT